MIGTASTFMKISVLIFIWLLRAMMLRWMNELGFCG